MNTDKVPVDVPNGHDEISRGMSSVVQMNLDEAHEQVSQALRELGVDLRTSCDDPDSQEGRLRAVRAELAELSDEFDPGWDE